MKTATIETEENKVPLRVRQRLSESVALNIPVDVLEDIRRVASGRDMSEAALLKLYIGQGLRQDLSRLLKAEPGQ